MSRFHVNSRGKPGMCRAKNSCPFGGPSEHFATKEAAQIAAEASGMKTALKSATARRTSIKESPIKSSDDNGKFTINGKEFSVDRAKELANARGTVGKFLAMRAQLGDLTENQSRMSAAHKRLNKIADHAMVRDNPHLMQKLEHTVLADSSFFKDKNGDRIHVDEGLQKAADYKVWEDNRKNFENELTTLAQDPDITPGAYKFEGLTVKVQEGEIDSSYASKLPPEVIASISTEKPQLNVNKIKANVPENIRSQVIRFENVAEVVDGRAGERETLSRITPEKDGGNATDRFKKNAETYGKFVLTAQETSGGKTAIKNARDEVTKYAKDEADTLNQRYMSEYANNPNKFGYSTEEKTRTGAKNILFGGRHHDSGILVSARDKVDSAKAKELLTPAQIDACTDKKSVIDKDKASAILPPEQFNKLFGARKVSLTEARVKKAK